MKRFGSTTLIALLLCLFANSRIASATSLSVLPALQTVNVGDAFSLGVGISDVGDLFDYQFDLTFNPDTLRADVVGDGAFLTSNGGTSVFTFLGLDAPFVLTLDNTTGLITIADSLLGPAPPATGVSGSGLLATIRFTALAIGASDIGLANAILEDSFGNAIAADLIGGHVEVNGSDTPPSVPEPATLLLIGSAVTVLLRRQKTKNANTKFSSPGRPENAIKSSGQPLPNFSPNFRYGRF